MKTLKIKTGFLFPQDNADPKLKIDSLQNWLAEQLLHGKESRNRTRFLKLLTPRITEMDEERKRILEDNAKKKNGKIVYLTKENKETTTPAEGVAIKLDGDKGTAKFHKEFGECLNEDLILDITPSTSEVIYTVRDIILDTKQEFQGMMAVRYDELCQCFEGISEEDKEKKEDEENKEPKK